MKPDNLSDHEHSDYEWWPAFLIAAFSLILSIGIIFIAGCADRELQEDIDELKERYCALLPDDSEECKAVPR